MGNIPFKAVTILNGKNVDFLAFPLISIFIFLASLSATELPYTFSGLESALSPRCLCIM